MCIYFVFVLCASVTRETKHLEFQHNTPAELQNSSSRVGEFIRSKFDSHASSRYSAILSSHVMDATPR